MDRRDGLWRDVRPGDYVRDKNGTTWRVDRWDSILAVITNREGRTARVRPDPYAQVVILTRSMSDAIAAVQAGIGAEIIDDTTT